MNASLIVLAWLSISLPPPALAGQSPSCPALAGDYGRCVTRIDGREVFSGSARIRESRDATGAMRYELAARGGDGSPQARMMIADGATRRERQRDEGAMVNQITSTTVACAADGASVTSLDEVQLLGGPDGEQPGAKYSLRATYRRDRAGRLRVTNEWSFEYGPMTQEVTCTPGAAPGAAAPAPNAGSALAPTSFAADPWRIGPAADLPPATDLVSVTGGFRLIFERPLAFAPRADGAAVFVAQHGRRHAGIWAWRGDRFVVLRNAADPRSDIALDPDAPSCQVHVDAAPLEWTAPMEFQAMTYQGAMPRQSAHVYAVTSADAAEQVFMTCLTGRDPSGRRAPFRAADLRATWGDVIASIEAR